MSKRKKDMSEFNFTQEKNANKINYQQSQSFITGIPRFMKELFLWMRTEHISLDNI